MWLFLTYLKYILEYFNSLNNIDVMNYNSFVMVIQCDKIKPSVILLCMWDKFSLCCRVSQCELYKCRCELPLHLFGMPVQ